MTKTKPAKRRPRPRPRYVTAAMLRKAGACRTYVSLLEQLVGKKGKLRVTDRTAEALALAFPIEWFAVRNLLTRKQRALYTRVLPEHLAMKLASVNPFQKVSQLMRGLMPTNKTETIVDQNGNTIVRTIPSTAYVVQSQLETVHQHRLALAQAAAFAVAYNSPRK